MGNHELLPEFVRNRVKLVNERQSALNDKALYIYAPYTGSWEIFDGVEKWIPQAIVRTSGESRLSDFQTFQVGIN